MMPMAALTSISGSYPEEELPFGHMPQLRVCMVGQITL
jgi:hypothetical protein